MKIINLHTNEEVEAIIEPIQIQDYKAIKSSKEFEFNWKAYKDKEVYKLRLEETSAILGLICIVPYPDKGYQFLHIEAVEVGKPNKGKKKKLDKIAGCLIAFAGRQSFITGCTGVIMLVAKTEVANLYHSKYGFQFIGSMGTLGERMVSDYYNTNELIKKYLG
ncbi:MAG: hypothetical protein H0X33_07390 [Taibaiella sp.]|nr:hypothetical protein [Taibaiella sp.]